MKKYLSLLLAVIMIISCFPYVASAEDIVIENTIAMTEAATIRNGSAYRYSVIGNTQLIADRNGNSRRFGYVKFDFAPYKDDIDNITEVKFSFVPYTPVSDITIDILPDSMEDWSASTLTYDIAANAGMTEDAGPDEVLCTIDGLVNGTRISTPDLSDAVKEHLKNNPGNTIVCFKLHASQGKVTVIQGVGSKPPQVSVKLEVDIDELIQKNHDSLTFDKICSDPINAVSSNLKLISEGTYGTKITWESDSPDVDVNSGIIHRPRKGEGDKNVKLTATIENTGRVLTKEFDITLKESNIYGDDLVLEQFVYCADSTFVRFYYDIVNTGDIVCDPSSGNHRIGFVKFDFTGYEDYLSRANSMLLRIDTKADANVANKSDFNAYVLPQDMEDIDPETLTYTIAKNNGLVSYNDNLVFRQTDVAKATTYYSDDILPAIKKNIEEGGDSVVWLKFSATTGVGYTINGSVAGESTKPALLIKYPKPATELDGHTMTVDRVVNSNMVLPSVGEYGSDITWESDNESLISSSGEVRVDTADEDYTKEDSIANLTATLSADGISVQREFPVRVRRNGVYDVMESITVTSDGMVSDSGTLSVGGTVGRITVLKFDVSQSLSAIKASRKTVLKLYGSEEYENKSLTIVPITNSQILESGIDELSYDDIKSLTYEGSAYKLSTNFADSSYVIFDISEYLHSISADNAIIAIYSSDPQIILESETGVLGKEPKLIVSPIAYTDDYAAQTAADDIDFSDLTSENKDFIRNNLTLPTSGRFGSSITWSSSNENVVSSDGTVTRAAENVNVTLTATVTIGNGIATKSFDISVRKAETDYQYAESLAQNLAPDVNILTSSIVLKGENLPDGAVARWESSEPFEAKINGFSLELTRPNSADLPVVLTAYVTYNGQTASCSYNVTVVRAAAKNILRNRKIAEGDADAEKAIDEEISTVWNISNPSVTIDLNSAKVISGMTIVPEIASFGAVTISVSDDMYQWKTAYTGGNFEAGKLNYITFAPIAYGRYIKFDLPADAKAISFIGAYNFVDEDTDNYFASVVIPDEATSNFALTQYIYGNNVVWTSSSSSIVINNYTANVKQDTVGRSVTLTAEVVINNETYTNSYVVYIPAAKQSGGTTVGGGGGGSFIAIPTVTPTAPAVPSQPSTQTNAMFNDLSDAVWASDYITDLAQKGIINGKADGRYAPNDNLKREEMAKLLVLAFNLPNATNANIFTDVPADSWYGSYVASIYENGITKGIGDGTYGTGNDITRQDVFTMLATVLKIDVSDYVNVSTGFGDDDEIADYARGSINALKALGIVSGDNMGNVNPTAKITRAEIAKVISLAISK